MHSAELKAEALCWLRYGKKLDYVCTEGGFWSSDVLGVCNEYSIEVEVKTSRADLLAEFRNKKTKHAYYESLTNWSPNYFYFLLDPSIAEAQLSLIAEKFPKAGVLTYAWPRERPGMRLKCLRKPTKLHDKKPTDRFRRSAMLRMSSEVCGLHLALSTLKKAAPDEQVALTQQIVDAIIQAQGIEDWESMVPPPEEKEVVNEPTPTA